MHRYELVCFLDAINFVNALLVGSELDRLASSAFCLIGPDFGCFGYILVLSRRRKRQIAVIQYWRPISPTIRIAPARTICQTRFMAAMSRSRSLGTRGSSEG
jgi:hypothetical protein